jgi:peptidoglycan/xylan/chitin deacetylase (PgdA/CDA1 family)
MLKHLTDLLKRPVRPLRRSLRRVMRGRLPIILMYHRIGAAGEDPWAIAVSSRHFEEQLEILRHRRRIIQLRELVDQLAAGEVASDCAVVTFDDGYADNLCLAKPLLERFAVPATVFVTTGAVGRKKEYYWDELGRLILQPGSLPVTLHLEIAGKTHDWNLQSDSSYSKDDAAAYKQWLAWQAPPTKRHALYLELWHLLRPMEEDEREQVLARLRSWAKIPPDMRNDRRTLTEAELRMLAAGDLVEIGAHSITHASLPTQTPVVRDEEIRQSKSSLEHWLGRPITSFAYPYGDHDDASVGAVRRAGFVCACTTVNGAVHRSANRFRLPRIQVGDWDGEEFARRLLSRFAA